MERRPCCGDEKKKDKKIKKELVVGSLKKGPWTSEEDQKLIDYIQNQNHGCAGNWRTLPKKAGLERCGKSCRLRWTNYLRPDIKRGRFSFEEEETIIHLHSILGNKWSAIAARLPGRTDNEIKNYWNTHIRKRLLQMGIDPVTHRPARLHLLQLMHHLISSNPILLFNHKHSNEHSIYNHDYNLNHHHHHHNMSNMNLNFNPSQSEFQLGQLQLPNHLVVNPHEIQSSSVSLSEVQFVQTSPPSLPNCTQSTITAAATTTANLTPPDYTMPILIDNSQLNHGLGLSSCSDLYNHTTIASVDSNIKSSLEQYYTIKYDCSSSSCTTNLLSDCDFGSTFDTHHHDFQAHPQDDYFYLNPLHQLVINHDDGHQ